MWFNFENQIRNQSSLALTFFQDFLVCFKSEKGINRGLVLFSKRLNFENKKTHFVCFVDKYVDYCPS